MSVTLTGVLTALSKAKEAYDLYKTINSLVVDETANAFRSLAEAFSERERVAAMQALEDAKLSSNPVREIESAITIFRGAVNKTTDLRALYTMSATVALCYRMLGETQLAATFGARACEYVGQYVDNYRENMAYAAAANALGNEIPLLGFGVKVAATTVAITKTIELRQFYSFWSEMGMTFPLGFDIGTGMDVDYKEAEKIAHETRRAFRAYVNNLLS